LPPPFWFALNFHWTALGIMILPSQVFKMVGDAHKGEIEPDIVSEEQRGVAFGIMGLLQLNQAIFF